jgi:hypothetical protein
VRPAGYVAIHAPDHPRAVGGRVYEHILVVERALGRMLRIDAPVHHIDCDRSNNAPSNLVACHDQAYHLLLHRRQRAYDACGDANARLCHVCKRYDRQDDIAVSTSDRRGYERAYHRSCARDAARERYQSHQRRVS